MGITNGCARACPSPGWFRPRVRGSRVRAGAADGDCFAFTASPCFFFPFPKEGGNILGVVLALPCSGSSCGAGQRELAQRRGGWVQRDRGASPLLSSS